MKEPVYFVMTVMEESVTGALINAIPFDYFNIAWTRRLFRPINLVPLFIEKGSSSLFTFIWIPLRVYIWVLYFIYLFKIKRFLRKTLVGCRDWFGVIVNLLTHIELLNYTKTISLLMGSTNFYGGKFLSSLIPPVAHYIIFILFYFLLKICAMEL